MPNASGVWTLSQQFQARGQGLWPAPPGAPTIGTATAGSALCASVTFTAPASTGYPAGITSYTVTSTPGCITKTGASSPLVVTGLTSGTSYTFKVKATGTSGLTGICSAASNSITASNAGQQAYTSAGTYTWVAPSGVTSVSVVAVGGGGGTLYGSSTYSGGGGGLGWKNNISVTPGSSYTVVVGQGGVPKYGGSAASNTPGKDSYFISTGTVAGYGSSGGCGGSYTGTGGGTGGNGGRTYREAGGGGAAGYSGNGGTGWGNGTSATAGSGGGGGGGNSASVNGSGGGGVGILGQGANGAAGAQNGGQQAFGGGGGSGGGNGGYAIYEYCACAGTVINYAGCGGQYGGGGGGIGGRDAAGTYPFLGGGYGGSGAVRIIWPGTTRQFPSTCTGDK